MNPTNSANQHELLTKKLIDMTGQQLGELLTLFGLINFPSQPPIPEQPSTPDTPSDPKESNQYVKLLTEKKWQMVTDGKVSSTGRYIRFYKNGSYTAEEEGASGKTPLTEYWQVKDGKLLITEGEDPKNGIYHSVYEATFGDVISGTYKIHDGNQADPEGAKRGPWNLEEVV